MKYRQTTVALAIASTLIGTMSVNAVERLSNNQSQLNNNRAAQSVGDLAGGIIIKYRDNAQLNSMASMTPSMESRISLQAGINLRHVRRLATGAQLMNMESFKPVSEVEAIIERLIQDPNVEYAEPDRMLQIALTPNDSRYNEQWHYYETAGGLGAPAAWDTTQGENVVVAVLDTGYRPHADLNDNLLPGYDMISNTFVARDGGGRDSDPSDPGDWTTTGECGTDSNGDPSPPRDRNSSWHGTHVAGTVAAEGNNSVGVTGVAYKAKVVPVRVLGRCGGLTSDIADGIIWASGGSVSGVPANANPAKVINLSLGGGGTCSATTQNAINTAFNNGATVVVAAGNSNANVSGFNPANCNNVVSVASTTRSGGRSYFSNFGSLIDVAAPGGDMRSNSSNGILSTYNTGTTTPGSDAYAFNQGTSMAAPHVAGVAALLYAAKPTITPTEVESTLKSTARSFPATCSQCGSGIVVASAAVQAVDTGGGGGGGGNTLENGVAKTGLSGSQNQQLNYTMEVPAGATNLSFAISGGTGDADLYVRFGAAPTLSVRDCRPWLTGNNETCNISNVQAGTYHIMINGYSSFSGVSLVGNYTASSGGGGGGAASFENTNNFNIPDNNNTGITSTVSSTRSGASGTVAVDVAVVHTYIGDLIVDLIHPDGTVYNLHNRTGGSANNINSSYNVNVGSKDSAGTWSLRVRDRANQDTGYIDSFKISFQ